MKEKLILFGLGAFAYGLIEILWRGRTHWTMVITGGLCFVLFSVISRLNIHILYKCVLGSLAVTCFELVIGVVFNIMLGSAIWDYSKVPFNLFGQVCVLYSVLWGLLCIPAIPAAGRILKKLETVI